MYRLIGGSTDQSENGPVDPDVYLTTGNGSHYGNSVAVQVKACKSYPEATLCSVELVGRPSRSASPSTTRRPAACSPS